MKEQRKSQDLETRNSETPSKGSIFLFISFEKSALALQRLDYEIMIEEKGENEYGSDGSDQRETKHSEI